MFHIGKSPVSIGVGEIDKAVIDEERSTWLRFEMATGKDPGMVFKLKWEHRLIVFEATLETKVDDLTGSPFYLYKFQAFGESIFSHVPSYEFADATELDAALLLTAEALITFGGFYNGDVAKEGEYRVAIKDKILRRGNFVFS